MPQWLPVDEWFAAYEAAYEATLSPASLRLYERQLSSSEDIDPYHGDERLATADEAQ